MRNQVLRVLQRAGNALSAPQRLGVEPLAAAASSISRSQQWDVSSWKAAPTPLAVRGLTSSAAPSAAALTQVAVKGDVQKVIAALDSIVSSEGAGAKEVADAAVALAYLQVKGNRRIWGKVFEKAAAVKASFDNTTLPAFLWAATTANVTHFKTVFELSGPAAGLLKSLSPASLAIVVEAFGKAGVRDAALHGQIATQVLAKLAEFKASDLVRTLYGFASSGVEDAALTKGISAALVQKAGDLTPRDAAQALWALATLRRGDKATLDAVSKALKGKGGLESAADAGAAAWAAAILGYKLDTSSLSAALKTGAAELTASQAVESAWGLALSGSNDKDAISALFAVAASTIDQKPCSVDVGTVAHLYEASVAAPGAKLADNLKAYAQHVYGIAVEADAAKRGAAALELRADVASAAAYAAGARYRPEIASALKSFKRVTPEGLVVDLAVDLEKEKVAIEVVDAAHLNAAAPHTPLGPAVARAKVLGALGYKAVLVPETEWAALKDTKAKALYLLTAVRSAAPGAASRVDALKKKVDEPFNAYAD